VLSIAGTGLVGQTLTRHVAAVGTHRSALGVTQRTGENAAIGAGKVGIALTLRLATRAHHALSMSGATVGAHG
jgi:predicted dinucleotide-binding enzyme